MSFSIKICFIFLLTTSILIQLINSECVRTGFPNCDKNKCCNKKDICTSIKNKKICKSSKCQAVGEECLKNCCENLICGTDNKCKCQAVGKVCVEDSQCCGNYCGDDNKCH
ncbi:unnamed protein product [Meloidogyne enterolobii]|uniref:Uncharacterized protein n=1 Tax=Meloidogyne enterolobii TaxID=390850 RepID=A0ACB0ZK36_MELEN